MYFSVLPIIDLYRVIRLKKETSTRNISELIGVKMNDKPKKAKQLNDIVGMSKSTIKSSAEEIDGMVYDA